jgi:hypothetical protein
MSLRSVVSKTREFVSPPSAGERPARALIGRGDAQHKLEMPSRHWRGKGDGKIQSSATGGAAILALYRGRNGLQEPSRDSLRNLLLLGMGRFNLWVSAFVLPPLPLDLA